MASRGNTNAIDLKNGQSAYGRYNADSNFYYDAGLFVLPIASETASTVTVRCHGGYAERRVKFDISKNGNPPVIPSAEDTVGNDKLTGAALTVETPAPNMNTGGYNWTVRGEYRYVTTTSPRIPGSSLFPAVGYPFPLLQQDTLARKSVGGTTPQQASNKLKTDNTILQDEWVWPLTIFPSNLLGSPSLISADA